MTDQNPIPEPRPRKPSSSLRRIAKMCGTVSDPITGTPIDVGTLPQITEVETARAIASTLPPAPPNPPTPPIDPGPPTTKTERIRARAKRREARNAIYRDGSKLALGLVERLGEDVFQRSVTVARELLDAKMHVKGVGEVPDNRTRLEITKLIWAYREGMPVERQIAVTKAVEVQMDELEARIVDVESPLLAGRSAAIEAARRRMLPGS